MAAITLTDVQAVLPEITAIPAAFFTYVNTKISVDVFDGEDGISTKLVRIYLAAHMATAFGAAGERAAGPITSESEGGISRSYSVLSSSLLGGTEYGIKALWLMRLAGAGAWLAEF